MRFAPRALAAVGALALTAALAACGGTATVDGEGTVTAVETPVTSRSLTQAQVDQVLEGGKPSFKKTVKTLRKCDRNQTTDSYRPYPCLAKAAAVTTVVDGMLAQLVTVEVPAASAATVNDLKRMSKAGQAVASKCRKENDQTCDKALARFRADEQSLLWDLQIDL